MIYVSTLKHIMTVRLTFWLLHWEINVPTWRK